MSTAPDTGDLRGSTQFAGSILIVEPEGRGSSALVGSLRAAGFDVHTTSDPGEAVRIGRDCHPDLALVDQELAEAVAQATELAAAAILLADGPQSQDAPRSDTFMDVITRPATADRVLAVARVASELADLSRRNAKLENELAAYRSGSALLGCSPPMRRLSSVLSRAAENDATVLIEGKPGSGKTLAAHIIHASGRRSDRRLISVPSISVDESSMTNLLHEADGATLLLEDVDELPAAAQGTLVRFLKERTQRGQRPEGSNVRLLTTTSARLPEQVARGAFREDLYYRLSLFPVVMPALHERREDVALLAMHFLKIVCEESNTPARGFTPTAMMLLESHPWPGNTAQLETAIRRAHALAGGGPIDRMHLLGPATGLEEAHENSPDEQRERHRDDGEATEADILPMAEQEKRLLTRALKATRGNVRRASQLLGIGRATLYRKIQVYKLKLN